MPPPPKESKPVPSTKKEAVPKKKKESKPSKNPKESTKTESERAVNPMTMIPENVNISRKMPLPPKAEQLKRLFGF
jgi:hypothetical protein